MDKPENPPAFPSEGSYITESGLREPQLGMTLRDYFAAKAMHGLLVMPTEARIGTGMLTSTVLASHAYEIADDMLRERERTRLGERPTHRRARVVRAGEGASALNGNVDHPGRR